MKKIIFCEGQNDSIFFDKLFTELDIHQTKIFDQKTSDILKRLKHAETIEINRFIEKTSPYQILVKSEAGKGKAIPLFSRSMGFCFGKRSNLKPVLMLDLDGAPVNSELKKLKDRIKSNKTVAIDIESGRIHKTSINYLYENVVKIKENKKQIGTFYLVLFASSLEKELNNIDPSNDASIEDKISQLVELPDIQNTFSLVLD